MQGAPVPKAQIILAAELCNLAQLSNPKQSCCNPGDAVRAGLASLGLQMLETLEMNTFPLGLVSGFVAHDPKTGDLYVALSGVITWELNPMPTFWDKVMPWKGKGLAAQAFAQTATNLRDTIHYCLRRVAPKCQKFLVCGFGLAAPVAYLLHYEVMEKAIQLGFQLQVPIIFACPKFVDNTFAQWAKLSSVLSLALEGDWLPRKPTTPLNWQFEWAIVPLAIDMQYRPLLPDPLVPGDTIQLLPQDYVNALRKY
jgi:hypothetical protein